MDVDELIAKAIGSLEKYGVDVVVQWTIACELIGLKYGWTVDEASTNLSNLLASLD